MNPAALPHRGAGKKFSGAYRQILRRAWLPAPVLLLLIFGLALFAPATSYESPLLVLTLNVVFSAFVSIATVVVISRGFLHTGSLALLLLGCGALAWGLGGVTGVAVAMWGADMEGVAPNILVTVHNSSAWLSGAFHLAGAAVAQHGRMAWSARGRPLLLLLLYALVTVAVAGFAKVAVSGWTLTFFIPGEGGTLVRQAALGSAIFMFLLTVLLLREGRYVSPFRLWYGNALLMMAVGLLGLMLQMNTGSALGWTGRTAMFIGGLFMLAAAFAANRERRKGHLELSRRVSVQTRYWYWVTLAIVAAAAVARSVFLANLGERAIFVTFFPAVMLAALYGGFRAGVLANILAALAINAFWLRAEGSIHYAGTTIDLIATGVFLVGGLISAWLAEAMQRALRRARRAEAEVLAHHEQLEALIRLRTAALQREITERHRVEEELRRREEGFRTLADGVPAIIARFDRELRYLFVSRAVSAVSNRPPESFVGRSNEDIGITPPLRDNWNRALEAVFSNGQAQELEFSLARRGEQRRFLMLAVPENGADGVVRSVISITTDITERKQAEEALKAAKTEAERANNAKSRFLAAASHDLRQPLSALALYVDVLSDRITPDKAPLLRNMKDCVGTLSELLTDLLDLSTLEAGVVTPELSDFPLSEVLDAVVSMQAPHAGSKGLRLRCRPSSFAARTDPVLFRRLLGNFVSNAVRYTRHGGVLVACRRRNGRQWVEVWDTGIGIPQDKTGEIFEEFTQLGNEERSRSKGSGLGLAIVARTAALLGLQIRVESRPGRGSMFAIEVPPGKQIHAQPKQRKEQRPLCIALVEDNADLRQALIYALQGNGHRVLAAASGDELRPLLAGEAPDIVVSDYRLGEGKTGLDIVSLARTLVHDRLPAVIITGDTDPEFMRKMAQRRITVVHKPFDIDRLQQSINELAEAPAETSTSRG